MDQQLRDAIVRRLMRVGCATAADLANEIPQEASTEEVFSCLRELVTARVVRPSPNQPANQCEWFVLYELGC